MFIIVLTVVSGAYEVLCVLVPAIFREFGWLGDPMHAWLRFWHVWIGINACLAVGFSAWFLLGGLRDLRLFFRHLQHVVRDDNDDGTMQANNYAAPQIVSGTHTHHQM